MIASAWRACRWRSSEKCVVGVVPKSESVSISALLAAEWRMVRMLKGGPRKTEKQSRGMGAEEGGHEGAKYREEQLSPRRYCKRNVVNGLNVSNMRNRIPRNNVCLHMSQV